MEDITISYHVPSDFSLPELRGMTLTGGQPYILPDGQAAIRFATRSHGPTFGGKPIVLRLADKPDLQAIVSAATEAAKQVHAAREAILEALGWPQYQVASRAMINAEGAYDAAAEYGYPAAEAAAVMKAEAALKAMRRQYPGAAAYALAESFSEAANYQKAAAGREAMEAIERGHDPAATIAAMEHAWSVAASKAVDNS